MKGMKEKVFIDDNRDFKSNNKLIGIPQDFYRTFNNERSVKSAKLAQSLFGI